MFVTDFVLNGNAHGPVAQVIAGMRFDPGMMRPYWDKNDRAAVTVRTGRWTVEKGERRAIREHVLIRDLVNNGVYSPVFNSTTLRKEEWIELDRNAHEAYKYRLTAWADLERTATLSGFDGMATPIIEHETVNDPGVATLDIDGLGDSSNDNVLYQLEGMPLPILHAGFFLPLRKLSSSRRSAMPLDMRLSRASGDRVGELLEKLTIGNNGGFEYGGNSTHVGGYGRTSAIYGMTSFPQRNVYNTLTPPTDGGWSASVTLDEVLEMLDILYADKVYGPFIIYHSNDWDRYMDSDYILTGGNVATQTLRARLKAIPNVQDVKRLDMMFTSASDIASSNGPGGEDVTISGTSPFQLIIARMTPQTGRAVIGQPVTVIQWETHGGWKLNFKTFCIKAPQYFADFYGHCGLLHATTA